MTGHAIPVIDLSVTVETNMLVFPGDPAVNVERARVWEEDGYNVLSLHLGSQSGTHVDAPFHMLPQGEQLENLPLTRFIGWAVVADVRHVNAEAPIEWRDLVPYEKALRPGRTALLHTGWSDYWGDYDRYRTHPWLSVDATQRLVAAGIRAIGIDALSIDATPKSLDEATFRAHEVILGAGGVIYENLTNMDALGRDEWIFSAFPLKLPSADGAPVRAVAYPLDLSALLDTEGRHEA